MSGAPEPGVVVGVVGKPWGRAGQFLLDPRGCDPGFLLSGGSLRLRRPGGETARYTIEGSHIAGGRLVVRLEGCSSIEEARALAGAEVVRDPAEFIPVEKGRFYPHELVGLEVLRLDGTSVGRVERVVETAGADLLEVGTGRRHLLIPFVEAICRRVDPAAGTIEIDPPEGLLELAT